MGAILDLPYSLVGHWAAEVRRESFYLVHTGFINGERRADTCMETCGLRDWDAGFRFVATELPGLLVTLEHVRAHPGVAAWFAANLPEPTWKWTVERDGAYVEVHGPLIAYGAAIEWAPGQTVEIRYADAVALDDALAEVAT